MAGGFGIGSEGGGMAVMPIASPPSAPTGQRWMQTSDGRVWYELSAGQSTQVTGMSVGILYGGRMYPS